MYLLTIGLEAVVVGAFDGFGAEAGHGVGMAIVDGGLRGQAQGAARGQLVGFAAAVRRAADTATQDPEGMGVGAVVGLGEVREVGEGGEGGGAGADDRGALARVTGPHGRVLEVRDAVRDPVGCRLLAERGQSAATRRARGRPGTGRVDHGTRQDALLAAVDAGDVDDERLGFAVGVDDAVPAGPGDTAAMQSAR